MEDPKDMRIHSISTSELERRWKAVREIMREQNIDFLLMRNDNQFSGGYVKWFSDFSAENSFPFTVIFPGDDEMTLISVGGAPPSDARPPQWALRGVKERLQAPYFISAHYTSTYDAELAVRALKKKKGTIGLVGRSCIPVTFYEYLRKHLPGRRFVDATDWVDQLKAIKSSEEMELIKRCAALQDIAMEHTRKSIRPGRRDYEIVAEAQYACVMHGSEGENILVGSCAPGTAGKWRYRNFQNRLIRDGDQVSVLIEVSGPGGFYTHIGRIFSLGKPRQELQDAFGTALEAQRLTLDMLKPGAHPKDIQAANNAFLQGRGYLPETRLYAHGQGYDFAERPFIRSDEPMNIRAGMSICVHPAAATKQLWAIICDNYLTTENGVSECLHKTAKEIILV